MTIRPRLLAAALASLSLTGAISAAPAAAAVDTSDAARFVDTLADEGFAALRTGDKAAARTLLLRHFAVDAIGERLIRSWTARITPAQKAAYRAAFPNFIVGTYADRLTTYARSDVKVIRTIPGAGGTRVLTQVQKPGAARPIQAEWTVAQVGGAFKVTNLTVAGINLAVTQAADFDSVIRQRGFDALVGMMKARG